MLLGGLRYNRSFSRLWRGKWFLHDLGSDCNCFTLVISTSNGVEQAAIANLNYSSSGANRSLWSNTAIFIETHSHLYDVGIVDLEEANVELTAHKPIYGSDRCVSSIYCRCCL